MNHYIDANSLYHNDFMSYKLLNMMTLDNLQYEQSVDKQEW